jgi:putative DNA primase/helicase
MRAPAWEAFARRGLIPRGENFAGICPAHEDNRRSLSIAIGENGRVLLKCFAGCKVEDIVESIGLKMTDLFAPDEEKPNLPQRRLVKTYSYIDEDGVELYQVCRFEPKGFSQRQMTSTGAWIWSIDKGTRRVPYRLPELIASGSKTVFLVEGEKDVDALVALGLVATTIAGGAGAWKPEYGKFFVGRNVVILPDNDDPGMAFALTAATHLDGALLVSLPVPPKGDVSDWIAEGGTRLALVAIVMAAAKERVARAQAFATRIGAK